MCFGGAKTPEVTQADDPSPSPTITPSESSPSGQAESRKKRTRAYRSGFASTQKTGALGVQDNNAGKTKLGQ